MKKTRYKIEYKDSIDMRCVQIVYGETEKKAINNVGVSVIAENITSIFF